MYAALPLSTRLQIYVACNESHETISPAGIFVPPDMLTRLRVEPCLLGCERSLQSLIPVKPWQGGGGSNNKIVGIEVYFQTKICQSRFQFDKIMFL